MLFRLSILILKNCQTGGVGKINILGKGGVALGVILSGGGGAAFPYFPNYFF